MTEKKSINLKVLDYAVNFQKSIIENFMKYKNGHNEEDTFNIFSMGITGAIVSILYAFQLRKPEYFMDDLKRTVEAMYKEAGKNYNYMRFKDGKK